MALKKKDTNSSSDSSSSNSSSSSSTSSSTSGSESSSSDSENTSTSGGKSANPSSDSDKKTQQKKKNSTTVTPKSKTDSIDGDKSKEKQKKPQPPKSTVYSSDTDDSSPKPNAKRKPQPKPKSSATVTPVPKTPKTSLKNGPKKLNPPRKVAQKNVTPKDSVKTSSNKLDDSKKSKTKSIFSPDNSSDSDDQNSSPPPPKLTAMKTAATKVHNRLKSKPKPLMAIKPRTSSVSSNSSESSRSSRSSSDSNHDSGRSKQGSAKKKTPSKRDKKSPPPPQLVSDADSVTTRKQTRSLSNRKSKHVMSRMPSESDSDTGSKTSITKSPVKRPPKESFMQRKIKSDGEEERKCPMEGCDSNGHLGGKILRHFTLEACPLYHNLTPHLCKEAYMDRLKKDEERKKAIAIVKAGRAGSPTPEQKLYRDKVKELRGKTGSNNEIKLEEEGEGGKDRQPPIAKYSNKYDMRLFQEAQAVASEAIEDELKLLANVRYTKLIEMGKFEMEVWYQSPYPEDFARLPKLYICEYCLRYMKARKSMERHAAKCVWRHPPGEEVYRKEKISVWEVDGKRYKSYCQNLCLLAKFFLDHKTLYYDVEPFLFYVMTIGDSEGCHTVGYFSKEKNSFLNYNVSCILTLPPYQRQGYGRLLIDFSYLLTRVEGKIGSPEKPLSDLGLISYRSYWKDVLLEYLCNLEGKQISIKDISQEMAINSYDIVSTLQALGMMKYWKGKHIILKKQDVIEEYIERSKRRGVTYKEIDPNCLKWTPFVPPSTPNSNA
ncbi:unnamed protein product [Nezara viridula]|uniref:Histone acetyltransferase n=2 Tax=Nezara viridula TaxID=85310 RepID=A0A9P0HUU8_NEZVI|nr:unnamed protein product [Nezara viridula]